MTNLPLNIDWQQICLHLFNFALLFGIIYFLLYKPIKDFMDKRMDYYRGLEEDANAKLSEAEAAKSAYEEKMKASHTEIETMKKEALAKAGAEADHTVAQAKAEADKIITAAKAKAQKEADVMIELANDKISDMLEEAAKKLISDSVEDSYEEFLDSAERGEADDEEA